MGFIDFISVFVTLILACLIVAVLILMGRAFAQRRSKKSKGGRYVRGLGSAGAVVTGLYGSAAGSGSAEDIQYGTDGTGNSLPFDKDSKI